MYFSPHFTNYTVIKTSSLEIIRFLCGCILPYLIPFY